MADQASESVAEAVFAALADPNRRAKGVVLEARVELRKVFWPTRQETFTTTLVVLGFVVVASIFFWLLDLTLASATRFITGQGS